MELMNIMEAAKFRISEGSEYCWDCYGANAQTIDFSTAFGEAQVIFSTRDQTIFEVTVATKREALAEKDVAYRWRNPAFIDANEDEAKSRDVDNTEAWDDVHWIDLDVEEDILEKLEAIMNGDPFDPRILMSIEMSDEDFLIAAKAAHRLNITLNEFCEKALTELVAELKAKE